MYISLQSTNSVILRKTQPTSYYTKPTEKETDSVEMKERNKYVCSTSIRRMEFD